MPQSARISAWLLSTQSSSSPPSPPDGTSTVVEAEAHHDPSLPTMPIPSSHIASTIRSGGESSSDDLLPETAIMLRNAWPPVLVESLNGLREAPPKPIERLGDRLAEGVDCGFIPKGLEEVIENDPELGYQCTKPADYDAGDTRSADELAAIWQSARDIFLNARDCKNGGRDENAWCVDVVQPLLHLAMRLYGNGRWWLQSVQSQSINPAYLSSVRASDGAPCSKVINGKANYVFSYSHRDPTISTLYARLAAANRDEISHTLDPFTAQTALFSGVAVRAADGVRTEAELHMSIWIAASLRKKQHLAHAAQLVYSPAAMVEPTITIVGHEHCVYYAYPQHDLVPGRSGVHVVGPDRYRFGDLGTDSIRGVFRLIRLYGNLLRCGADESEEGYWGGFLGAVLETLAKG